MTATPAMAEERWCSTGDFVMFSSFLVQTTPRFMKWSIEKKPRRIRRRGGMNQGYRTQTKVI